MRPINYLLLALLIPCTAYAAGSDFIVPIGERQLFLDNVDIADMQNLTRTMHRPDKKGAVIRPDASLPVDSVQIRMAPIWHPKKKLWQLWDCAASPVDLHAEGRGSSGYYESKDGLHWTKPVVGLVEYRGSKENNYVYHLMGGKPHRVDCIIRDDSDPDPARRYKTAVPNVFRQDCGGTAVSPDGIHWTEISSPGIYGGDEWNLTFDAKEHLYLQYMKRGSKHGRAIWLSTSKDFETWTEPELIFEADDLDQELGKQRIKARIADPRMQRHVYIDDLNDDDPDSPHWRSAGNIDVYTMSPSRYESLYIGFPAMYHATGKNTINNTDGFHLVELISSRSLKNWTRQGDRKAFIPLSPIGSGAYDTVQMIGPTSAVVRDNELWFYYTGIMTRGPEYQTPGGASHKHLGGGICLAVLRRDGFISLDAGEQAGTIQTEPFKLSGTKLLVNVDVVEGELRVELLNGDGNVVAKSKPLTGDLLREPVQWAEGDIADLKGRIASLRFTLRNAQFYSYWLE